LLQLRSVNLPDHNPLGFINRAICGNRGTNMRAIFFATLMLISQQSFAQGIVIFGSDTTCADWIEARTSKRADILEGWTMGTLNGLALGYGLEFWRSPKGRIEPNQAYLWLDNWCRQNPLSVAVTGIVRLFDERTDRPQLPKR
jgi:hypothetical protein